MTVDRAMVGLGAGGHASVVLDMLSEMPGVRLVGLLDANPALHGRAIAGVRVLGGDDLIVDLVGRGVTEFFVGVGSVATTATRRRLYELGRAHGLQAAAVIHTSAVVSKHATVGSGVTILAGAVVNAGAVLGANVLVNTGAIVEHACIVGDHVHVATGARLLGDVRVGDGVHVGAASTVLQGVHVADNAVIGAGAVVLTDVEPGMTVVGVPARAFTRRS